MLHTQVWSQGSVSTGRFSFNTIDRAIRDGLLVKKVQTSILVQQLPRQALLEQPLGGCGSTTGQRNSPNTVE